MRPYRAAPPDADTFDWSPDVSDLEPPTHLPLGTFLPEPPEPSVIVGEIVAAPLHLDEEDQRSINGGISRHSISRSARSYSSPSVYAPTPIRTRTPRATPPAPIQPVPVPAVKRVVTEAKSRSAPKPAPAPAPAPVPAAAAPPERPSPSPLPGIDPLMIGTPPELAPTIFGWIRRLALQSDLKTADKLMRDALADVTSSLTVAIVYPGAEELYSLGSDNEVPKDPTPIIMVAQARRAMIASHTAIIPIVTTADTVGVILLTRNPRNPGYTPIEQVSMLCLARESASVLHNLAQEHVQRATEVKADAGSLYRGEALEAHRNRGAEGMAIELSPGWVRRTYPILVIGIVVAIIFSIFIHVPTYSTGRGIIVFKGARVQLKTAGVIDKVYVTAGQKVKAGTPLFKLNTEEEQANHDRLQKEYEAATYAYIDNSNDQGNVAKLSATMGQLGEINTRIHDKTYYAAGAGIVEDLHVHSGQNVNAGDLGVLIIDEGALPIAYGILPGADRPRLHANQELQIALGGFNKAREKAEIKAVNTTVMSGQDVISLVGKEFADALRLEGSFALVEAPMTSRTFKANHQKMYFHHGMQIETEVRVASKPFLVTLLPALEKYLPD